MLNVDKQAVMICEDILRGEIQYNIEHSILPSENRVSERLLRNSAQMAHVYTYLLSELPSKESVEVALGCILSTAAFWSPEDLAEARVQRDQLNRTNQSIAEKAQELAELLRQRDELREQSSFTSSTHIHICDAIEMAASQNHKFQMFIEEGLSKLHCGFSLNYWPKISEVVSEIGRDAGDSVVTANDPLTAAGTESQKASKADFIRALLVSFEENSGFHDAPIPLGFSLPDSVMASIMNSALDLDVDNMVDASYIKRLRQRMREAAERVEI